MRTLFWGGTIVDGTGSPGCQGNLLVEGDRITKVQLRGCAAAGNTGAMIPDAGAACAKAGSDLKVIDCRGLVVAPGFIDTHSHSDLYCLSHPEILPKVMQGVTTEIVGQDGLSAAPCPDQYRDKWEEILRPLDGRVEKKALEKIQQTAWKGAEAEDGICCQKTAAGNPYRDTETYLRLVEAVHPGPNIGLCVPHGNVRMEAMGLSSEKPDCAQLSLMQRVVSREMECGAFGLSTGLIYPPCSYADEEELAAICRAAARMGRKLVIHQRSEADDILDSMREVFRICRKSGAGVHFSHFKVCGRQNERKLTAMLQLLDEAEEEGIDVSFDQYPYPMGITMLSACLPPEALKDGLSGEMKLLQDPSFRAACARRMMSGSMTSQDDGRQEKWDNFFDFAGPDNIYISGVKTPKNRDKVGMNLTQIAQMRGISPADAVFDLLLDEENDVSMVDYYGTEDQVGTLLQRPEMNVCTDGLYTDHPHPRVYGTYPRILGRYVREQKLLPLESAVRKMTGRPAEVFRIRQRGILREGNYADITVFDPDRIRDTATFERPAMYPEGILHVCVNGVMEVMDGEYTGRPSGCALRK